MAAGEVVERFFRHADDVVLNKYRTFTGAVFRMLEGAFPFHDRPAFEVVGRQLAENRFKVDLTVSQRPEAAGAFHPAGVTAVYALFTGGVKLGILYVESPDAFMVVIDIRQVVQ